MRFPSIPVRDLQGENRQLPDAFAGEWNLVFVAFDRRHQELVDSWVPWAESLVVASPGVRIFEVPTISRRWAPFRRMIDGGMAAAIKVPAILQRTLTFYGDVSRLTTPLQITDRSTISVLLLDRSGEVVWRTSGAFDASASREVERLVPSA